MKKALFTFITGGVEYTKGNVYTADEVANLDQTNFEDTTEAPTTATVEAEVDTEVADTKADVDTEVEDDNKGDVDTEVLE